MPMYDWNKEKARILMIERGISFDLIVEAIDNDKVLEVLEHHHAHRRPNQKIIIVEIDNYAYAVPCIYDGDQRFLKTAYASRKFTQKYLRKGENK
jgi:uncharacterized DUF497 family protein